jgi:hypothetical protein
LSSIQHVYITHCYNLRPLQCDEQCATWLRSSFSIFYPSYWLFVFLFRLLTFCTHFSYQWMMAWNEHTWESFAPTHFLCFSSLLLFCEPIQEDVRFSPSCYTKRVTNSKYFSYFFPPLLRASEIFLAVENFRKTITKRISFNEKLHIHAQWWCAKAFCEVLIVFINHRVEQWESACAVWYDCGTWQMHFKDLEWKIDLHIYARMLKIELHFYSSFYFKTLFHYFNGMP